MDNMEDEEFGAEGSEINWLKSTGVLKTSKLKRCFPPLHYFVILYGLRKKEITKLFHSLI